MGCDICENLISWQPLFQTSCASILSQFWFNLKEAYSKITNASWFVEPFRSFDGQEEHREPAGDRKQWLPHAFSISWGHSHGAVWRPDGGSDAAEEPKTEDATNRRQAASTAQRLERRGQRQISQRGQLVDLYL